MNRFVGATIEQFERFFVDAATVNLSEADYPPCCGARSGPVRFRRVKAGGVMVEVRPCRAEPSGHFLLDMLFATGSCPFPDAVELSRFWNGPLADAFGLPRGPLPERMQTSLLDDLNQALPARRPARQRKTSPTRQLPAADVLVERLASVVRGQEIALQWLSSLVVSQLAKRTPDRPATALLIGPSGVGKTSTVEALPAALAAAGWPDAHLHRIDCNELSDDYDVHRFLGSAPGLVGYTKSPPLLSALRKEGCIVLLDEIDKAHPAVQEALYSLLDRGRIMAPDGTGVSAPGTVVAMTSACGADDLLSRLHRVVSADRRLVDRAARAHLREHGWPVELISRIDTVAVYHSLDDEARRQAAAQAIRTLADEYGFTIASLPPVVADVVLDIADDLELGTRGFYYAARRLLGELFAAQAVAGGGGTVTVDAGPPLAVAPALV